MDKIERKFKTLGSFFDELTFLKPGEDFIFSGKLAIYGGEIADSNESPFELLIEGNSLSMVLDNCCPKAGDWYDRYFISFEKNISLYVPVLKNSWALILQDPGKPCISKPHIRGEIWGEDSKIYIVPKLLGKE